MPTQLDPPTLAWIALGLVPGIGGVLFRRLVARFGSPEAVLEAPEADLLTVPGVGQALARAIRASSAAEISPQLELWRAEGMQVLTWECAGYPANLRALEAPPPLLFLFGQLGAGDEKAVAIVGTRRPSRPAQELAQAAAEELAGRGITVVSGMARGIDLCAHRGALQAGGRTLAVVGVGLHRLRTLPTADIAPAILHQGAIFSELHPETGLLRQNLVARNRLITGLSRAVIVVETGIEGGSMHAARFALRQGRPIFAVPGSAGCDALLQAGARPLAGTAEEWDRLAALAETPPSASSLTG